MNTATETFPPAPGLVRRVINDIEYWVHELTGEIHSLFTHNKTVIHEAAATAETAIGESGTTGAHVVKDVTS